MKKMSTRFMMRISIFTAISVVLYFFEFPIPGSPLKMDLSDLPVLLGSLTFGPFAGAMIALLKNVIHFLFMSRDGNMAGEIANLGFSLLLLIPIALTNRNNRTKTILGYGVGLIIAVIIMNVFNYYITFPLYGMSQDGAWVMLNTVFLPFNLIKGGVLLTIVWLISPQLKKVLK